MDKLKRVIPNTPYDDMYLVHNRLLAKKLIELQEQTIIIMNNCDELIRKMNNYDKKVVEYNYYYNFPEGYVVGPDNELYRQKDDNKYYPVAHPDLSTQPSILSQRFGNKVVREVLIRRGYDYEIPPDAIVLSAFSFNNDVCIPATVKKVTLTINADFAFPLTMEQLAGKILITNAVPTREALLSIVFTSGEHRFKVKEVNGEYHICGYEPDAVFNKLIIRDDGWITFGDFPSDQMLIGFEYNAETKAWKITNSESIAPTYTLVTYAKTQDVNPYYYQS